MQFSSRPSFNDDPMPWIDAGGWRSSAGHVGAKRCDPRPEFDRPQHNPTNPILARYRERIEKTGEHPYWGDNWDATMDYLDFAQDFPHQANDRPEHVDHARRVLARLARLTH